MANIDANQIGTYTAARIPESVWGMTRMLDTANLICPEEDTKSCRSSAQPAQTGSKTEGKVENDVRVARKRRGKITCRSTVD